MSESNPETRDELLKHLESLTGRAFHTREDIQAYVREAGGRKASDLPSVRRWIKAKHFTLMTLLAFGVIQYYMLDVMLEIVSLQTMTFFVPASARVLKSALTTLV